MQAETPPPELATPTSAGATTTVIARSAGCLASTEWRTSNRLAHETLKLRGITTSTDTIRPAR